MHDLTVQISREVHNFWCFLEKELKKISTVFAHRCDDIVKLTYGYWSLITRDNLRKDGIKSNLSVKFSARLSLRTGEKRFAARTSRAAVSHYLVSAAERHFTIKALRNRFEFRASIQPRAIKHAIGGNAFALQRPRYYYYIDDLAVTPC